MDASDELDRTLRASGHRVTRPRRAVWRALRRGRGHRTVEEIAASVAAAGDEVDTASLYRTLALFEDLGIARVSRLGDRDAGRWELAHPDEHFHLVCQQCGDVDHHVGTLVAQIREHLDRGHGFAVEQVELVVTGRCTACQHTVAS
ncbi:Fur family transcriptional regulator [Egicoccus halophilus]|uniref:Peroxide-responsive repressor PerR n=1 Tax=Egicoccus halophilus TaxID=1670830 RepID=A0A8J3A6U1_9ACTN|nr:Fur family transcriptional regulator [Egicoccus halophilus]GGI02877.1 peroxide-responsive repressor PerR [Egicoccus halophilus]